CSQSDSAFQYRLLNPQIRLRRPGPQLSRATCPQSSSAGSRLGATGDGDISMAESLWGSLPAVVCWSDDLMAASTRSGLARRKSMATSQLSPSVSGAAGSIAHG